MLRAAMPATILETPEETRAHLDAARARGKRVGLVPTMGALHEGHLALVKMARARADHVLVSIFVNPTQFGPNEDFARYPRDLAGDVAKLEGAGADAVFAPDARAMYPEGEETRVRVGPTAAPLCGKFRPVHFEGVTTVVAKLFAVAGPCVAVFGKKDYQQLQVIRRMATDLFFPVEIAGHPIVREADGVALSSRNAYLSREDRLRARGLSRGLMAAQRAFAAGARRDEAARPRARRGRARRRPHRLRRGARRGSADAVRGAGERPRARRDRLPRRHDPAHRQRGPRRGPACAIRGAVKRGRFVVLEGIDGSGTTTQVGKLGDRLRAAKVPVRTTREPSDGPIGTLVRQVLTGRIVVPGGRAPEWTTMALLFAADRMDHVESEIEPFVASGGVVLSDRYDASSLAYQSVSSGKGGEGAVEWIRSLNRWAKRPDLTIVLDLNPDVAAERRESRGDAAQLYEQNEVQRALAAFYRDLARHMPGERVVVIDGMGTPQEVHERVFKAYESAFAG
jgi:pantoate--beta-alanine ligase/dTMP kinase